MCCSVLAVADSAGQREFPAAAAAQAVLVALAMEIAATAALAEHATAAGFVGAALACSVHLPVHVHGAE